MGKNKYVTDDDYVKAEYVIYNNLDEDIFPGIPQVDKIADMAFVKALLKEDEEIESLTQLNLPEYILTSYGRILNTNRKTQIKPRINNASMHIYVTAKHVDVKGIFEDKGWEYDLDKIRNNYLENNWQYAQV